MDSLDICGRISEQKPRRQESVWRGAIDITCVAILDALGLDAVIVVGASKEIFSRWILGCQASNVGEIVAKPGRSVRVGISKIEERVLR